MPKVDPGMEVDARENGEERLVDYI